MVRVSNGDVVIGKHLEGNYESSGNFYFLAENVLYTVFLIRFFGLSNGRFL